MTITTAKRDNVHQFADAAAPRLRILHRAWKFGWAALPLLAAVLFGRTVQATSFSEPGTTFYGKVFDLNSGYQVLEGDLTWVIHRSDGINQVLHAKLQPLNGGEYSYAMDVPHQAVALGLDAERSSVPLRSVVDTHLHLVIAVNGRAALLVGPSGSTFDAAQALRTATYRLDLAVPLDQKDSDGSGLPDWWKLKYRVADPNGDPDGDGLSNRAEFALGSDPNHDDRIPSLTTKDLRAYGGGTTVVRLKSIDSDSAASNLVYTLTALPEVGELFLRSTAAATNDHDLLLGIGSTFSQADVNDSRVVFTHRDTDSSFLATTFSVALRDENSAHGSTTNSVAVNIYKPEKELPASAFVSASAGMAINLPDVSGFAPEEQRFVASFFLSKEMGYIVNDASAEVVSSRIASPSAAFTRAEYESQYVPRFGADRSHVLLGGLGDDRILGSMESDVLIGGRGNDTLRGNGGSDLFLITGPGDGNDTIEDFTASEGDVIDISRVLRGQSTLLTDYVNVTTAGTNSYLNINFGGTGTPYTDMVVTLKGIQLTQGALYTLVDQQNLIVGDKSLPAEIAIAATIPAASENGPVAGEFSITRAGSAQDPVAVNLLIGGTAVNGVDYEFVPSQIRLAAGQRTATIPIKPYPDTATELSEIVMISIQGGGGYTVGTGSSALVTIADLLPELTISAIEPRAIKADQYPGAFLISRAGAQDRSVLVRLSIGGTAVNGTDYARISPFVSLAANQTAAIIEVTPLASANLQTAKSVQLTILPDSSYFLGGLATSRVMLVEAMKSFLQWRTQYFPGSTSSLAAFASEDPGNLGIPNIQRYAYGLDAYAPDRARLPRAVMRDGFLTLDFNPQPDAADISYMVAVSRNLADWDSSASSLEQIFPEAPSDPNVLVYRAFPAVTNASKLFFKVQLNYQP